MSATYEVFESALTVNNAAVSKFQSYFGRTLPTLPETQDKAYFMECYKARVTAEAKMAAEVKKFTAAVSTMTEAEANAYVLVAFSAAV